MEEKSRLVLKHTSGLYWSVYAEHTKKLFNAKRFADEEQVGIWLSNSIYAPENIDEYKLVPIKLTIEEEAQ